MKYSIRKNSEQKITHLIKQYILFKVLCPQYTTIFTVKDVTRDEKEFLHDNYSIPHIKKQLKASMEKHNLSSYGGVSGAVDSQTMNAFIESPFMQWVSTLSIMSGKLCYNSKYQEICNFY